MRKKLKDVCMFYSGTGFPIQYQGQTKGEYPFYKVGDIANNAIAGKIYLELCNNYISSDVAKMIKGCILPKDTVVFAKIGEALKLNRRAITSCDCLIDNNAMGIAPKLDFLRIQYFYFCMKNLKMQTLAESTTVPSVRKTVLEKYEIEVPSLVEQEEIEKKLTLTQKIIEKRRQELSYLDEIIKARFVELFECGDHEIVKASDVCDFITKGTTPPTGEITEEYENGKIPFLKVYNLSFTGEMLFDENPQYILAETHNGKLARSKVYPNDVLMNIVGPPLGKFTLVTDEFEEWNINQAIAIFRAKERILPRFLLHALMQPKVLEPFIGQAVGIRQQNLSLEQCRNLQFPLPSLEEQKSFVEFAEQLDKSKFDTMTFAPIYAIINLYLHTYFYQGRR